MARWLIWAAVWLSAGVACAAENLVRNPSFEAAADQKGFPPAWQTSGNRQRVSQALSLDRGRDGKNCARLACTRFAGGTPDSHAMICQMGVPVKQGTSYRLTLWARAEALAGDVVQVALSDTSKWQNCGLQESFAPTSQWTKQEFIFRATRTCAASTRFQIWFNSTGTLWLDDVELVEIGRDLYRPGQIISGASVVPISGSVTIGGKPAPDMIVEMKPKDGASFGSFTVKIKPKSGTPSESPTDAAGRFRLELPVNLVPNASFECGTDGWGSAEGDRVVHWGGRMNRLFGEIDATQALDGRASLKIALSPENQPVSFFDYYELTRTPIRAPLAGNLGFMEVEPGKPYTFSVYMKADRPDTPARLRVQQFQSGYTDKSVRVSTKWERYSLTFKPWAKWCYVLAGPDLCRTKDNPDPPKQATVWLDAVQLEQAKEPSDFRLRRPIEFGISTGKPGNVFGWDETISVVIQFYCEPSAKPRQIHLSTGLYDFFDKDVWNGGLRPVDVVPGKTVKVYDNPDQLPKHRGFFTFRATAGSETEWGGQSSSIRLAAIPKYRGEDSRFGVNHAYPWPHLLDLSRQAGLVWVRDWSLKWQEVEPEQGKFQFAEPDFQIDRPRQHGLEVLGLLPFPSSNWSSSAPASVSGKGGYPQNRARVAYAPRDEKELENYVATTVAHYKGRVRWWQVFNESLFTDYSLPRKHGYDGGTYARLTKAFARAARRADPQCRVLAGIGYIAEGQILDDFGKFFAGGGLEAADAIDIHHYPGIRPPEFLEGLLEKLNALMDKHGRRKPIWLTEYGYYADDDPATVPLPNHGFDKSVGSERLQAEYAVRWATIGLAGGIEKIFYHAGTCHGLNDDNMQGVFFKYGGQPRRIYAAQAVLAQLLTPTARFVKQLALGDGTKTYLFRDGERLVAVAWSTGRARPATVTLTDPRLQLWDLMGRPQPARQFTPAGSPVYVVAEGVSDETFAAALRRE